MVILIGEKEVIYLRQLTSSEELSISKLLQLETNSLVIEKAGIHVIADEELRMQAESGIMATEARIRGLQQFLQENNIAEEGGTQ